MLDQIDKLDDVSMKLKQAKCLLDLIASCYQSNDLCNSLSYEEKMLLGNIDILTDLIIDTPKTLSRFSIAFTEYQKEINGFQVDIERQS